MYTNYSSAAVDTYHKRAKLRANSKLTRPPSESCCAILIKLALTPCQVQFVLQDREEEVTGLALAKPGWLTAPAPPPGMFTTTLRRTRRPKWCERLLTTQLLQNNVFYRTWANAWPIIPMSDL